MTHDLLPEPTTTRKEPDAPPPEALEPPTARTAPEPGASAPRVVVPSSGPVLIEVAGDTGIVLGQALRDVVTWAGAAEAERPGVFGPGAAAVRRASLERVALPSDLAVPMGLVAELVANPGVTKPLLVTRACLRVAQYLCRQGAGLAALAYARAALLATPDHPRPLLEVARLVGPACAEEARVYLLRAALRAEERGEPAAGAEIHAELAALAFRRRDGRAARGHLLTAARDARRGARAR